MQNPTTPTLACPEQHDRRVDRPDIFLAGGGEVQRHHQLACAIRLGGSLAVVQVGRQRSEAGRGETVDDVLDVRHKAPPFLNDQYTGAGAGDVAVARVTIAL